MKRYLTIIISLSACLFSLACPARIEGEDLQEPEKEDVTELKEIVVTGSLVTQTNTGITYNMAGNHRAQAENAFQALKYVPFIDVNPDGDISVQGSSTYSIYINGRPYELVSSTPQSFLESIPASRILRVEVITNPGLKFGADAEDKIINIVLRSPIIDGYALNFSGEAGTRPQAKGSLTALLTKNAVDASMNYEYDYDSQRDQTVDNIIKEINPDGDVIFNWRNIAKGDGGWHTHIFRAMLKWNIDSLNSLYGDFHGRIMRTNTHTKNTEETIYPEVEMANNGVVNSSEFTAGSAEANLIYRNYYNDDTEHLSIGYNYTYNPDRRFIDQREDNKGSATFRQQTTGGLNTHNVLLSYLLRLPHSQYVRFSASERYRFGDTESSYHFSETAVNKGNSMRYTNNIASVSVTYNKYWEKFSGMIGLKAEYSRLSMCLSHTPENDYKDKCLYMLSYATFYWRLGRNNTLYFNYTASLRRPDIEMLNPFVNTYTDHSQSQGNPGLKVQYNHDFTAMWFFTKIRGLTLAVIFNGTFYRNIILPMYEYKDRRIIISYSNVESAWRTGVGFNMKYTPLQWLTVSVNGMAEKRWLRDNETGLRQNDFSLNITPHVDFHLDGNWNLGVNYGYHKAFANPLCDVNGFSRYAFYIGKSFLKGRLNLMATATSPFNKYNCVKTVMNLQLALSEQKNFITSRYFGLSVSYVFSHGRDVSLSRDDALKATDQNTGIR